MAETEFLVTFPQQLYPKASPLLCIDNLSLLREHILWDGRWDLAIGFHNVHIIADFDKSRFIYVNVYDPQNHWVSASVYKDILTVLLNLTASTPHTPIKGTVISYLNYCNKLSPIYLFSEKNVFNKSF